MCCPATGRPRAAAAARDVEAETGLVVEDVETGWCGAVVRTEKAGGVHVVHLEDRRGRTGASRSGPGFLLDGAPVVLTPPTAAGRAALQAARATASRTASGSRAVDRPPGPRRAGSRIWSRASTTPSWSRRSGATTCGSRAWSSRCWTASTTWPPRSATSRPGPGRRLGVLVDHLVPGTKEPGWWPRPRSLGRCAAHVLVVGHPYVDVWQSVRPERLGLDAWPVIPRGRPWKHGVLAAPRLAAPRPRPTSPRAGGGSSAPCAPTPTSSRRCSAGSRS